LTRGTRLERDPRVLRKKKTSP